MVHSGIFTIEYGGLEYDYTIDVTSGQIDSLAEEVLKEHVDMLQMYGKFQKTSDKSKVQNYFNEYGVPYLFEEDVETCGIVDIENYNAVVFLGCPEVLRKICMRIKMDFPDLFYMIQKDFKEAYKSGESLAKSFDEPFDNLEDIFLASSILEIKHLPHEIFVHASEKIKNGWNKN